MNTTFYAYRVSSCAKVTVPATLASEIDTVDAVADALSVLEWDTCDTTVILPCPIEELHTEIGSDLAVRDEVKSTVLVIEAAIRELTRVRARVQRLYKGPIYNMTRRKEEIEKIDAQQSNHSVGAEHKPTT